MPINWELLNEPFYEDEIEWRVARSGSKDGKPWAMLLAYIDARAIINRLDEACGQENWRNEFREWHDGIVYDETKGKKIDSTTGKRIVKAQICTLFIRINENEWLGKEDAAPDTEFESIKGGCSDAFKRAFVHWSAGARALYRIKNNFAVFPEHGGTISAKIDGKYMKCVPTPINDETIARKRNSKGTGVEILKETPMKSQNKVEESRPTSVKDIPQDAYATTTQTKAIYSICKSKYNYDKDGTKDIVSLIIKRTIASMKDLLSTEASTVITALQDGIDSNGVAIDKLMAEEPAMGYTPPEPEDNIENGLPF